MRIIRTFLLLFVMILLFSSCKKCYTCQVRKVGIEKMIDFDKTCDEDRFDLIEDSLKIVYPDTLGYYIICR